MRRPPALGRGPTDARPVLASGVRVLAVAALVVGLAVAVPGVTGLRVHRAGADTVVGACAIVTSPTPTHFTDCPGVDLAGQDLAGLDLSYADLAGAILTVCYQSSVLAGPGRAGSFWSCPLGADLAGADLSGANLTDADLAHADLAGADLTAATLTGGTFTFMGVSAVNLTGADLSGDQLTGLDLSDAVVAGANLSNSGLSGANLTDADLAGANLTDALVDGSSFAGATLTGANLTGTSLVPHDQAVLTGPVGGPAVVSWAPPSALPGATPGSCAPPSGSSFALGTTAVTCTVLDDAGDQATGTFLVQVFLRPSTTVLQPDGSAPLSSGAWLDAGVNDPAHVFQLEFRLIGGSPNQEVTVPALPTVDGWIAGLDTTTVPNGTYTLTSEITDIQYPGTPPARGDLADSDPVTVTIDNQPLATAVLVPSAGATLTQGSVLDASAQGLSDVTAVHFQLACGSAAPVTVGTATQTVDGWIALADLTGVTAGPCQLQSTAVDTGGETAASAPLAVTVGSGP